MTNDEKKILDAYLKGEIPFEELPEDLQAEEALLGRLLGHLDTKVHAPAGFREDVMREIVRLPRSRWHDLVDWFLRPRTVEVTPAMASGLALAGLVALLLLPFGDAGRPDGREVTVGGGPESEAVMTQFVFEALDAESVTLTGDWVGWEADRIVLHELRGSGVWTVAVPVPAGVHEYSFVVDGTEWRPDPLAGSQADDGFGRVNSVLLVSAET